MSTPSSPSYLTPRSTSPSPAPRRASNSCSSRSSRARASESETVSPTSRDGGRLGLGLRLLAARCLRFGRLRRRVLGIRSRDQLVDGELLALGAGRHLVLDR